MSTHILFFCAILLWAFAILGGLLALIGGYAAAMDIMEALK